jgi:predicted peptidase
MQLSVRAAQATTILGLTAWLTIGLAPATTLAQPGQGRTFASDPRAEDRTYHFADTDETMPYCVFASSKISNDSPAPLIISLHGLGAPPQIMCNETAVDLAEAGGYILAAPMGCNVGGWYGSPVIRRGQAGAGQTSESTESKCNPGAGGFGGGGNQPANLAELSERDVMNVLTMIRDEFNVDEDRIYLTGHSMGGAGTLFLGSKHADIWAAIAPVAPAAFSMTENRVEILERLNDADVPVMVVHGDEDEAVPVDLARTWAATMDEIGMEHEYVELPGITHGPVITVSQEHVYEFFGKHSK